MTGSIVESFRLVRMRWPGEPLARAIAVAPPIPPPLGPVMRTMMLMLVSSRVEASERCEKTHCFDLLFDL